MRLENTIEREPERRLVMSVSLTVSCGFEWTATFGGFIRRCVGVWGWQRNSRVSGRSSARARVQPSLFKSEPPNLFVWLLDTHKKG